MPCLYFRRYGILLPVKMTEPCFQGYVIKHLNELISRSLSPSLSLLRLRPSGFGATMRQTSP
jgi:hypothetical protein